MFSWNRGNIEKAHKVSTLNVIKLFIQGKEHNVNVSDITPETTLNEYLRYSLSHTGTKRMCNEGGCGACVVAVTKPGDNETIAVNSCLVAVMTCNGWKIDTIEVIGNAVSGYHPIQKTLAKFNGTQCGFCSPGMVMNMYCLMKNEKLTMKEVENSFSGNICRCTGYRPILSAFKSLCKDASSDLLGTYPDIEDLAHIESLMKKDEYILEVNRVPVKTSFDGSEWSKFYNLKDLLNYLSEIGYEPYMLVAGNSAKGVYKLPTPKLYIDINEVDELISHQLTNEKLILGANMTLTSTMELLYSISECKEQFKYFKTMADHIDLIANVPVRNIASLAGNLMMKHLHNEFPSDVFLILETFGAKIVIVDVKGKEITITLPSFLKLDMKKKVIKSIVLDSLSDEYKYETHKIMPRAQNSHALLNAGFLYKLDSENKVQSANLIFGNINPQFIHATETEKFLIGKELFKNETLQGAFTLLAAEINPEPMLPEPEPEFRKQLSLALFFKGVLRLAPPDKLSVRVKGAGAKMVRPVSSGVQDFETNKSLYPLTEAIPKLEALAQTSGQAQYIDDIPDHPQQLYGKLFLAEAPPNSKIIKIDASRALEIKGIENFFTAKDIPGDNIFVPPGYIPEALPGVVEKIFADGVVEYFHQPIGILVGSSRNAIEVAKDLIEVAFEAPNTQPLITIRDILKANATDKLIKQQEEKPKSQGNDIKKTLSGTFDLGGQYHFHMETQCCLVIPTEDGLDMFPSTQWMDLSQVSAAGMLNIPHNRVNVTVRRCGGGFGAKVSRNGQVSCAAALAAWLTKKPVKLSLSLKENLEFIGKRFPFSADYKVDINEAGVIQRLKIEMYSDHSVGGNEALNKTTIFNLVMQNYNSDPFDIVYYLTKTDTPANTWARAPGSAEGLALIESIMDHIAYELNMDPLDVRINNITKEKKLLDYIGDLKEWADIDKRKNAIEMFNKENRWKKKGISIVPMAWKYEVLGPINVTVSIFHIDGSVVIHHGGTEIGQGINTKAAQVCAYKFNIPLDKIAVYPSNTSISPNCMATGRSQTSEAVCYGVDVACEELLAKLQPFRTDVSQTWEQLIQASYKKYTLLIANAQYSEYAPFVIPYVIYGACATEVEVDILTGQHLIRRVDLIEDTGTSMNPNIDIGQIEGAFVMGQGYYTTEKIVFDKNGRQLTNSTWYYKPPGAKDIPIDFRIKLPKNNPNSAGVLQSKAVGEPPLCLSVSVPLAIRHAVASARADADSTKPTFFFFDGPTSVENTFMNCLNNFNQYLL